MFPTVKRTPSQMRYADHAATELDELAERVGIMRSAASRLEEEKRHIGALLDKLTGSGEMARCDGECAALQCMGCTSCMMHAWRRCPIRHVC
jgi:hypothetical protein